MASGISLKELAAQLNLAPSTVSRALNDSYEISDKTKEKVLKMAEKLNYQPNPFARSLRENKSKAIAVIMPERINAFFAHFIDGLESITQDHGYHLLVYSTHEDLEKEKKIVNLLLNGRADAVIMSVSSQTSDISHLKMLHERGLPILFFDRVCSEIPTTKYITNDYQVSYEATKHLIQQGCKRPAFLMLSEGISITKERHRGFLAALKEAGISTEPHLNKVCFQDESENVKIIEELLSSETPPDGILASVEKLAIACYMAAKNLELKIPKELKVISFSNMRIAGLLNPALSTISQPAFEMGEECGRLLMKKLTRPKQPDFPDELVVLPSKLTIRASTMVE